MVSHKGEMGYPDKWQLLVGLPWSIGIVQKWIGGGRRESIVRVLQSIH